MAPVSPDSPVQASLRKSYEVTAFEAVHVAEEVVVYGIPVFRLPKKIVGKEIETPK